MNNCNTDICSAPCTNASAVKSALPYSPQVTMAYVPFQQSGEVYSCEKALLRGTLFPCLDKPFLKGCCK